MINKFQIILILILLISFFGCQPPPPKQMAAYPEDVIMQYLAVKYDHIAVHGGYVFCACQILGVEEEKKDTDQYYVWALCQEFYQDEGAVYPGEKLSMPVALTVQEKDTTYVVLEHQTPPQDSTKYWQGVADIFPAAIHQDIKSFSNDPRLHALESMIRNKVKTYFVSREIMKMKVD